MIACVGESLIDRIGDRELAGGCPFNTALAAARLGAPVSFYGKFSGDRYGQVFLEKMIDCGMMFDPDMCSVPEPTMTATAVRDSSGNASYTFTCDGSAAANVSKEELDVSLAVASDIDIVFFGSIALIIKPICDAVVPAIRGIRTKPAFFFDPNVRPALVDDPASFRSMVFSLAGESRVVKTSVEDLAFLFPGLDEEAACRRMLGKCMCNLIVTRGEGGSTWFTKSLRVDCPACTVPAGSLVDTIGCGDVFNGAVLAYLEENGLVSLLDRLEEDAILSALEYASRAAAVNCMKEGCEPPFDAELSEVGL